MLQSLHAIYQIRVNKLHKFRAKIQINTEVGSFRIKTVESVQELREAFMLRYEVFHREMIGKTAKLGLDIDEFDFGCDHLVIQEKRSNKIVGTYRLNCSDYVDDFYSEREFNLQRIMAQPGVKLELGRACIHKDYRKGSVISLLWRGIAEYMVASDSRLLFGCASIKVPSAREAALLYRLFFEERRYTPEYLSPPTREFTMPDLDLWMEYFRKPLTTEQRAEAEALVPSLCRAYLKMGAYLGGEPAWDEEFKCIDFLTVMHREDINKALWKRFRTEPERVYA